LLFVSGDTYAKLLSISCTNNVSRENRKNTKMHEKLDVKSAKNRGNKTLYAIALILTLTMTMAIVTSLPTAKAVVIPTYLLLSVAPNPVGVGQIVYVNAFLSKPTATMGGSATANAGDRYEKITVDIVQPDGTKKTLGPFTADTTGGTWASFVPTKTGNYALQAFYPGQTLTYGTTYNGSIMMPSVSAKVTLIVQENPIAEYGGGPAEPTGYWSRPIYAVNYAWAKLGGNWLGLGAPSFATTGMYDAVGNFQPYSPAPNTGHILWTKPTAFGGQVGEPYRADQSSQYTSTSIVINHWEPIIIYGILYYNHYPTVNSVPTSWVAVDLRTGQTLWTTKPGITGDELLRYGQVFTFKTVQEYGSTPLLWSVPRTGATTLRIYDPMTGAYMAEITNASNLAMIADYSPTSMEQGTLLGWYTIGGNLTLWNSTKAIAYPNGFDYPRTQIRIGRDAKPSGSINWSAGIQWSVPIATKVGSVTITSGALSIAARTPEVILLRSAPTYAPNVQQGFMISAGYDAITGKLLWGPINQTIPEYEDFAQMATNDGVNVMHNKDSNEAYGYSLTTGEQLWGPVKLIGNAWSTICRGGLIAYGKVYIWDYGGYVNALDLQTGQIKWTWSPRSAGYNTPYGIWPLWHFGTGSIADGKLFLSEGKMYDPPLSTGCQRLAINCTDGTLVWSILSYGGRSPGAIADGFLVEWNSYDCQIYTFGKGQTATSISASPKISVHSSSVLIEGMVTDESPGTKDSDREARFPNGVPAVSDASISDWMEYVYMQQLKPTNATGVTVHLTALDPNGNTQEIGTVTSDASGMFKKMWTPPVPGEYTVIASFEGSESYYASYAETAIGVSAAPAASPTATATPTPTAAPTVTPVPTASPSPAPQPEAGPSTDMYIIAAAAAVIIAAVAAAAVFLRKHK